MGGNQEINEMDSRGWARAILMIAACSLLFAVAGCRRRSEDVKAANASTGGGTAAESKAAEKKATASYVVVQNVARPDDFDLPHRVEMHETYKLEPGAEVELSNFNGRVEIETADVAEADLYIVRSARESDAFKERKVNVEHQNGGLKIWMERAQRSVLFQVFSERHGERQRVILRLPRRVDLSVEGVAGRLKIGEIEGRLKVEGVHGPVELARFADGAEISGINGRVRGLVGELKQEGLKIEGVNGQIELEIASGINADLDVERVNGRIENNLQNFTPRGEVRRSALEGRIGKGGAPIEISAVNGRVWIGQEGKAEAMEKGEKTATESRTVEKSEKSEKSVRAKVVKEIGQPAATKK